MKNLLKTIAQGTLLTLADDVRDNAYSAEARMGHQGRAVYNKLGEIIRDEIARRKTGRAYVVVPMTYAQLNVISLDDPDMASDLGVSVERSPLRKRHPYSVSADIMTMHMVVLPRYQDRAQGISDGFDPNPERERAAKQAVRHITRAIEKALS